MVKYIKEKPYFTTREVAELLGRSTVTVFRYIKSGKIKAEMFGKTYVIPKEEVEKWIDTDGKLTDTEKGIVKEAVGKTIREYGEALRMLGKE